MEETLLESKVKEFVDSMINLNMRQVIDNKVHSSFSEVLDYCARKAWHDAVVRERFFRDSPAMRNKDSIIERLKYKIDDASSTNSFGNYNYWFCSNYTLFIEAGLILPVGIWQKLVNMTFKYLYCFKNTSALKNRVFPWGEMHCPIDSVIAQKLMDLLDNYASPGEKLVIESVAQNGLYGISWNSFAEMKQYDGLQDVIHKLCQERSIDSNLFFDFVFWEPKEDYRKERIDAILDYLRIHESEYPFKNDGKHIHVMRKEDANSNIVKSVRSLGYEVKYNDNGSIAWLDNGKRRFRLDYRANNITSSSMLSVCFFASLIDDQGKFKRLIQNWIPDLPDVCIEDVIDVKTEYVDYSGDRSHIDALISFKGKAKDRFTGDTKEMLFRIFVEVKYCENAYGPKQRYYSNKMSEKVKSKLKNKHIKHWKEPLEHHSKKRGLELSEYQNQGVLAEDYERSLYARRYQIIRNVAHASLGERDYCLFLLAKGNREADFDIMRGLKELEQNNSELIKTRVKVAYFEEIDDLDESIRAKYFS